MEGNGRKKILFFFHSPFSLFFMHEATLTLLLCVPAQSGANSVSLYAYRNNQSVFLYFPKRFTKFKGFCIVIYSYCIFMQKS